MPENSPKMTLEEKIVQTIKDDKLYALIGDEDAITKLVERALHEALYQPQRIKRDYGGWEEKDSPVVSVTREIAKRVAANLIEKMTAELLADAPIRKLVRDAIVENLPNIIMSSMATAFSMQQSQAAATAMSMLQDAIRNKTL